MTASDTARLMTLCADRLTAHPDTARRAAELALPATNTSDVHVASSGTSDPTYQQATAPVPAIATYQARWRASTTALQGWVGSPLIEALRASAPLVAAGKREPWGNPYLVRQIRHHCDELITVIDGCRPMDLEAARKALDDENQLAGESCICHACESVTGISSDPLIPSTTIVSALCRPGCYDLEKRHEQRGTYIDRATFINHVKAGVARGEITRPASPLWRTAVPVVHDGDVA